MNHAEIRSLFDKFGAAIDRDDVWQVQSATVIKHKALERLAAAAKIEFERPQVLRAERDEAVILVIGKLGDRSEWSIGEALIGMNYKVSGKQAGYVYAMAEKRAKDRVIIKLAGLHGLYSEDEADEFKESSSAPQQGRNAAGAPSSASHARPAANLSDVASAFIAAADMAQTKQQVAAWMTGNVSEIDKLPIHEAGVVKQHARDLYKRLPEGEQEAAE
jgi:hypothetical protein